jgi:hypothetical protein
MKANWCKLEHNPNFVILFAHINFNKSLFSDAVNTNQRSDQCNITECGQLNLVNLELDREAGIVLTLHWNCEGVAHKDQMILHLLQYAIVQSVAHHVASLF